MIYCSTRGISHTGNLQFKVQIMFTAMEKELMTCRMPHVTFLFAFKVFTGNKDQNTVVRNDLKETIITRFIRIHPVSYSVRMSLRAEFHGCIAGMKYYVKVDIKQVRNPFLYHHGNNSVQEQPFSNIIFYICITMKLRTNASNFGQK